MNELEENLGSRQIDNGIFSCDNLRNGSSQRVS